MRIISLSILVGAALWAAAAPVSAASPAARPASRQASAITVTVFEFKGIGGVPEHFLPALSSRMRQRILEVPRYRLIDQANSTQEVQMMVTGRVSKEGDDYTLIVEILNPGTMALMNSYVETCGGCKLDDLLAFTDAATDVLFKGKSKAPSAGGRKFLSRPQVPPLPTRLSTYASDVSADILVARDAALKADATGEAFPERASAAWAAVAGFKDGNPYLVDADARRRDWDVYAEQLKAFEVQRRGEAEKLQKLLPLESVGLDEKRASLWSYAKRYGSKEALALLTTLNLPENVIADLNASHVRIDSVPPEAAVTIDGDARGYTPFEGTLPNGTHRIRLEYENYKPAEQSFVVMPDLPNERTVVLQSFRELHRWVLGGFDWQPFVPSPAGRELSIDGRSAALPDAFTTKTAGSAGPTGAPWGFWLDGGVNHFSGGYRYARAKFDGGDFAAATGASGNVHVREALWQTHRVHGGYNWFWGDAPMIRVAASAELGYDAWQASAAGDHDGAVYGGGNASFALAGGAAVIYKFVSGGLETGLQFDPQGVTPSVRLLIGAGGMFHAYR